MLGSAYKSVGYVRTVFIFNCNDRLCRQQYKNVPVYGNVMTILMRRYDDEKYTKSIRKVYVPTVGTPQAGTRQLGY